MSFYSNFLSLCNSVDKTPSKVVLEIGLKKSAVTRWKNGSNPTDATSQRIADYFGVSVLDLTADDQKEKLVTVPGDELSSDARDILDMLSQLSPEEVALAKSRIVKIIESR